MPAPRARTPLARARYRASQFVHGLRPHLSAAEVAEARGRLSAEEFRLFLHAEPRDRRHSMDLYRLLQSEGASEAALVAALVHDTGKGRLATWHRVAFVILNAAAPGLSRRVEREGAGWRGALWRLRHHGALGAALLEAAGSDPRVVEIVRGHTGTPPPGDDEIARFIEADDRV
ncbi:MAG: hypothetical protein AMXMBFR23_19250 [Chloroflexota bacterium]